MQMDLTAIPLSLFFLYFVLISGQCDDIMNCRLQKFIGANVWFKHVMIYMSIVVFTFVLNWYTYDSLAPSIVEKFEAVQPALPEEKPIRHRVRRSLNTIVRWFTVSAIVYLIFVISSKTEWEYLIVFLILILFSVMTKVFLKGIVNQEQYAPLMERMFLRTADYNDDVVVFLHNLVTMMYIAIIVVLVIGCHTYYQRQRIEHADNWRWTAFFFGSASNCVGSAPSTD